MKRFAVLALRTLVLGLPATTPFAFGQSAPEAAPALAEVHFDVPDMTCSLCPLTVKTAMSGAKACSRSRSILTR